MRGVRTLSMRMSGRALVGVSCIVFPLACFASSVLLEGAGADGAGAEDAGGTVAPRLHWNVWRDVLGKLWSLLVSVIVICFICGIGSRHRENRFSATVGLPNQDPASFELGRSTNNDAVAPPMIDRVISGSMQLEGGQAHASYDFELQREASRDQNRLNGMLDQDATREADRQLVRDNMRFFRIEKAINAALMFLCVNFVFWYVQNIYLFLAMICNLASAPACEQPLRTWVILEFARKFFASCDCMPRWPFRVTQLPRAVVLTLGTLLSGAWLAYGAHILENTTTCQGSGLEAAIAQYIISLLSLGLVVAPMVLIVFEVLPRFGISANFGRGIDVSAPTGTVQRLQLVPFEESRFRTDGEFPTECCICTEAFDASRAIRSTHCKHLFHEDCLTEWVESHRSTCPLCREDILDHLSQAASDSMPTELDP